MTVEQLRQQGYKVRVTHRRPVLDKDTLRSLHEFNHDRQLQIIIRRQSVGLKWSDVIIQKGGHTQVDLTDPNGKTTTDVATCSSKDMFNKKIGVSIALGRCLKKLAAQ